jgi:LysR family transcriptional regulator, hca operon transcriptional activator
LLQRGPRGVQLTVAGRAFLDPARTALMYVEAAAAAAQRAAKAETMTFVFGFLASYEMIWLPDALRILREDFPNVEIVIRSQSSPELAEGLLCGKIDIAFLRPGKGEPVLTYKTLTNEPLIAAIPRSHHLAASDPVRPEDIMGGPLVVVAKETAPHLRAVLDSYAVRSGIVLDISHEVGNLTTAISLIASTGIPSLLPLSAVNLFPPSVIARPLAGEAPTVALAAGYNKTNPSAVLRRFLERLGELVVDVTRKNAVESRASAERAAAPAGA